MSSLLELLIRHGLLLIFAVTFAARVGVPLPAAPLLVVAGGLAASDELSWPAAFALAIVANLLGDGVWYQLGRAHGYRVMKLLCRISLSSDSCVRQSEALIGRWGGGALLGAKFLPGISVVAAPMAGAMGMSFARFLVYDLVAAALWSGVFMAMGFLLKEQIQQVLDTLARAGIAAGLTLLAAVAAMALRRRLQRRKMLREISTARISVEDAIALIEQGLKPIFIDVRADASRAIDPRCIPGALSLSQLNRRSEGEARLPLDSYLVLYCSCPNEISAALAAKTLARQGFSRVRALTGGLDGWAATGQPLASV